MTTKTLASSLAALAMIAAQGAVEPVWESSLKGTTINAVGFENFALGATPATSYDDSGTADSSKAYFLYSGTSGDDQSVVTNHASFAYAGNVPAYFTGLDNNKYLSLSTEGGTLFRSLNVLTTSGETPALGTAEAIPDNGLFVDTLVQFTPCEEAPAFNEGDQNKLAIWLNVVTNGAGDAVGTNLCVRAGYLTYADGTYGRTAATYTLANTQTIDIQAGEWVRLTVKAIRNIYSNTGLTGQPAFQVYINDELAEFNEDVGSADYMTQLATDDAAAKTALEANTVLPSMQNDAYLQAVGFQGTGAVDDFVVTTDKPGFLAVDFTLYWDSNILALDAYLNDSEDPVDFTGANLSKVFEGLGDGDTLEIELPAAGTATSVASGYEIDWEHTVCTNATIEPLTYQGNVYAYLFTLDGDGPYSVTLVTKASTPSGPFGGGTGTELDPYIISSASHLTELADGVAVAANNGYANTFFAMTGDIDMSEAGPFAGIGTYANEVTNGVPFCGTFDGKGYKISNVDFTPRSYAGFFNQVNGGTIKNLTISNITCSTFSSGSWSCSIVGNFGNGATLQNLVAEGNFGTEAAPCTHNAAGIAIRACCYPGGGASIIDCTNAASIVSQYTKAAGILGLSQAAEGASLIFTRCVNIGTIKKLSGSNGDGGVAGIVAYLSGVGSSAGDVVFDSCESLGSVTTTADPYYQLGTMIGYNSGRPITLQGTNIARADTQSVGQNTGGTANSVVGDLAFATVGGNNIATFVAPTFGDTVYYCMAANSKAFVLTNAADEISIDTSLAAYTGAVTTTVEDAEVATETSRTVTTYYVDTGSSGKTVSPGGSTELDASTAEAATNEAESVTIVISDAAADAAGQVYVLKKVITYDEGSGKYSVELAIDEEARNFVDPDEAVAVVAGVLSGSAASVTIPADKLTPGLYYSLAVATEVDGQYLEGARTLAAGNEGILFPISKPEGTKAFYKVLVNMLPVSAQ